MLSEQKILNLNYNLKNKIKKSDRYHKNLELNEIYLYARELNFNDLLEIYTPFLNEKKAKLMIRDFSYKKKGHLKAYLKNNKLDHYELFIQKRNFYVEKLYLLFHELTHLYNDHPISKILTTRQKEVVADTIPKMFIHMLNLEQDLENSPLYKELNLELYSLNWIKNGTLSSQKERILLNQIDSTFKFFYNLMKEFLLKKKNPISIEIKIVRKNHVKK